MSGPIDRRDILTRTLRVGLLAAGLDSSAKLRALGLDHLRRMRRFVPAEKALLARVMVEWSPPEIDAWLASVAKPASVANPRPEHQPAGAQGAVLREPAQGATRGLAQPGSRARKTHPEPEDRQHPSQDTSGWHLGPAWGVRAQKVRLPAQRRPTLPRFRPRRASDDQSS